MQPFAIGRNTLVTIARSFQDKMPHRVFLVSSHLIFRVCATLLSGVAKMQHTDLHSGPAGRQQYPDEEGPGYLPISPAHRGRSGGGGDGERDHHPPPNPVSPGPLLVWELSAVNVDWSPGSTKP